MPIFLETKRLIITTPELTDFDQLCLMQSNPETMKYIGQGVRTPQEVRDNLHKAVAHHEKHGFSFGCVYEKESGAFIGRAGLVYLSYNDAQPDIEIGYGFLPFAWNKGYGTELASAIITWGFQHLPIQKLVAVVYPNNQRSRHVLEKVKMRYVGLGPLGEIEEVAFYEIIKPVK